MIFLAISEYGSGFEIGLVEALSRDAAKKQATQHNPRITWQILAPGEFADVEFPDAESSDEKGFTFGLPSG